MEFFMAASLIVLSFLTFWKEGGRSTPGLRNAWLALGVAVAAQALVALVIATETDSTFRIVNFINVISWGALAWGLVTMGLSGVEGEGQPGAQQAQF